MTETAKGRLLASGRTAEVYAWQDDKVLKLYYAWCPPEWIRREAEVGRTLASTPLPTPRLLDSIYLDSRQGLIFDRVEGPSMLAVLSTRPWLLARMADQLAELHASMHEYSTPELPPVRTHLHTTISNAGTLPRAFKDQALSSLASLPDGNTLCHFDFHPDQVAMGPRGPVILDWMTALRGHPLADVARTTVLLRFGQAPHANWLLRLATDLLRNAFHHRYLAHYMRLHPDRTLAELRRWMIPVAAARIAEKVPGEEAQILAFIDASIARMSVA